MMMSDDQKAYWVAALHALTVLHALAEEFSIDPQKGQAAGYMPERRIDPANTGQPRRMVNMRSEFNAWLHGVARKDLPSGTWYVDETLGDGPFLTFLVLF